jgi:type II secretory pathway component PulF
MSPEDLITLNEEIAGMARAGLPLDQGLAALAREMAAGRLRDVTAALADDLRAGRTLPEALERQGGRVPPFYGALVAAGVRSGRVVEVLATLTAYARRMADLRATAFGALFYPAVVLAFALILFGFLSFFVIPQFQAIFHDFGMSLPAVTQWTFAVADRPLEFFVVPLSVLVGGFFLARLVLRRTDRGRHLWARFVYAVPVIGTLIRASRLAAFAELLAILVDHALPLPEALLLAGQASSDPLLADESRQMQHDLSQGLPLAEVLRGRRDRPWGARAFPELITWMTGLGEQRGALGPALHQVADVYRRQADLRAAVLRNVLPPFLIVVSGGAIVTLFVVSIMLPMTKLLEGLTK